MPWKNQQNTMERKAEFVQMADQPNANMSQLCRRFGISRHTGYKWLRRYRDEGREGLEERSRRPDHSPNISSNWSWRPAGRTLAGVAVSCVAI